MNLRRVRTKLRRTPPDKEEGLGNQMGKLEAVGIMYANSQAVCASAAMAVSWTGGIVFRIILTDYRAGTCGSGAGARANAPIRRRFFSFGGFWWENSDVPRSQPPCEKRHAFTVVEDLLSAERLKMRVSPDAAVFEFFIRRNRGFQGGQVAHHPSIRGPQDR